jgi:hypothetical protein
MTKINELPEQEGLDAPQVRRMFPTSFFDMNGNRMREGDYISLTETKVMNNYYYNGLAGYNRDPYKEWETIGTVLYLIEWRGDTLTAQRVKEIGNPHPSLSVGFHYLNTCFESKKYKIEGNKHEGYLLGNYA